MNETNEDECIICYETINPLEVTTDCCKKSTIHLECYKKCLKKYHRCPMCNSAEVITIEASPEMVHFQMYIHC